MYIIITQYYTLVCVCIYIYSQYIRTYVHTYTYIYIYTCVYIYIIYIHNYIYTYIIIYIYIHIYNIYIFIQYLFTDIYSIRSYFASLCNCSPWPAERCRRALRRLTCNAWRSSSWLCRKRNWNRFERSHCDALQSRANLCSQVLFKFLGLGSLRIQGIFV